MGVQNNRHGGYSDFLRRRVIVFAGDTLRLKEAAKYDLEVEDWMIADAICQICPELRHCDQQRLVQAVARVIEEKWVRQLSIHAIN